MDTAYVYSSLATDPDLGELVEMFVAEMPVRIETLASQARNRAWPELARTAHQLKGAAGSHGFGDMTLPAARLEHAAKGGSQEDEILASLEELLDLCRRLRAGTPAVDV